MNTNQTDSPVRIAETFFAHWSANRVDEALAMLSEDVLYDNVPFPDIVGRADAARTAGDDGDFALQREIRVDGVHAVFLEVVCRWIHYPPFIPP